MKNLKSGTLAIALLLSTGAAFAANIGSGSFTGASDHTASGTVSVTKSGDKITVTLGSKFFQDNAPDRYVTLGHGDQPVAKGIIQILKKSRGSQTYTFSAKHIDLGKLNSVVIWCKQYSVPLGIAKIK